MLYLIKNWQIALALFGVLSLLGAGVYFKGVSDGIKKQASQQAQDERKAMKEGQAIEKQVMRMPKSEVQKKLEAKWCRDCP